MNREFEKGYLMGFRDGELAAKEAMGHPLDQLEQKYLAIQYAADAAADAATYAVECSISGQPEDMG